MKSVLEMTREELIIRIMDLEASEEENVRLEHKMSDMMWAKELGRTHRQRDEWSRVYREHE
jgi:hypothetical protein